VLVQWGFAGGRSEWGGQQLDVVRGRGCYVFVKRVGGMQYTRLRRVSYARAGGRIVQVSN
jgi:hypothetical protein